MQNLLIKHKAAICKTVGKILVCVTLVIIYTLAVGCAQKTKIEYVPVNVPQLCQIDIPSKPNYTGDTVADNLNIMKYAEQLYTVLKACVR